VKCSALLFFFSVIEYIDAASLQSSLQNFVMSTKTPSQVVPAPEKGLERIAYAAVASVPTAEPHDQDRLGYSVWKFLTEKRDSLEQSVHNAGARLLITEDEALDRIRESLRAHGL
jgi:hypothetical protein